MALRLNTNKGGKYIIDPNCQDYFVPTHFVKLAMKATEGMAKVRDELVA